MCSSPGRNQVAQYPAMCSPVRTRKIRVTDGIAKLGFVHLAGPGTQERLGVDLEDGVEIGGRFEQRHDRRHRGLRNIGTIRGEAPT